jgi:hypothetical protein
MNVSDDRSAPTAWIPWILALAALFGWSALAPDHLSAGKGKRQEGVGQVQSADDLPAPGVAPHRLSGLAPGPSGYGAHFAGTAERLPIEAMREVPPAIVRRGGVQGRAPPICG